jgi:hypothetical protein
VSVSSERTLSMWARSRFAGDSAGPIQDSGRTTGNTERTELSGRRRRFSRMKCGEAHFIRYVVSPFMWRQTGKCLVWLWTERVLRHIRDCLVSARRSLTMGPRAIDVLRSTKSFVHFVAECCAPPCLHCHDKLGISGAPRQWDPHGDGPGRGGT